MAHHPAIEEELYIDRREQLADDLGRLLTGVRRAIAIGTAAVGGLAVAAGVVTEAAGLIF